MDVYMYHQLHRIVGVICNTFGLLKKNELSLLVLYICQHSGLLKRGWVFHSDPIRRFFALPGATKGEIPAKKGGFTRGYIGFGGESGSHLLECKEAFSYG